MTAWNCPPQKSVRPSKLALAEDIGSGDATTLATVPETATARARHARARTARRGRACLCRGRASSNFPPKIKIERLAQDGQRVRAGENLLKISGPARAILSAERVALNFVQRLSGVATLTAQFVDAVQGTRAQILDTRKTTPGWRRFEKYAVACGGGHNHRLGLVRHDVDQGQPPRRAAQRKAERHRRRRPRAREKFPQLKIEVEADTLEQVEQAADAGADIILLDNMNPVQLRLAVQKIKGRAKTEASGGVNLANVRAIAGTGVDFISVGALTHSARAVDIGLDFEELDHGLTRMTTDAKILTALRANPDGVSGAELAEQLGISRAAIWARIEELRRLGYDIEASPHFGYRLVSAPDVLHADDLLARLGKTKSHRPRHPRVRADDLDQRRDRKTRARRREGRRGRFCRIADEGPRAGSGANGFRRRDKGLWFSILLRPDLRPQETTQLTVASATALRRAIQSETGLQPEIKWPNDILIGGKKVAGILTELSAELDRVKHVILGIGVDVNLGAGEFPAELRKMATSLRIEAGKAISRAELATAILRELDRDYARDLRRQVSPTWPTNGRRIARPSAETVTIQIGERQNSRPRRIAG